MKRRRTRCPGKGQPGEKHHPAQDDQHREPQFGAVDAALEPKQIPGPSLRPKLRTAAEAAHPVHGRAGKVRGSTNPAAAR